MSINSFLNDSQFSFKNSIDLEEKKVKNIITINLFSDSILQNKDLNGYLKIIINEYLDKGVFYLKVIGEENKKVESFNNKNNSYEKKIKKFLNNNNLKYLNQNYIKDNGFLKTKENSKVLPKIINSKNRNFAEYKLKNSQISNLFRSEFKNSKIKSIKVNKVQPINNKKLKKSHSGDCYFLNETTHIKSKRWIDKDFKIFYLNEEIEGKCLLILPFALEIPDEFYPTRHLKYTYYEDNYLNIINKFQNSIKESNSSYKSTNYYNDQNSININYKLKVYYISENVLKKISNLDEEEKLNYFETLKESNNYFENFKKIFILPNSKNLKKKYDKILNFEMKFKIIKFKFFCLQFSKYYNIHIKFSKRFFDINNSNINIIFYFNKNITVYYNYLDIIILSRFKNKTTNEFLDNILYISSNKLKTDKNNKNNLEQFIKKIDLNDICNKVECFEAFEEMNTYYIIFYLSKNSFRFNHLVKEIPIYFYNNKIKYNLKTKKQIISYYKVLERKINNINNISLLPFCLIKNK